MSNTKISSEQIIDGVALGGNPTTTTQSAGNNTTRVATTAFVTTAVANLVDSAPSALNTLNELAAALNDNASFFSTVLPLSGGTMTGDLILGDSVQIELGAASGGDLQIFHNGSNSQIKNVGSPLFIVTEGSGQDLYLRAADDIFIEPQGGETGIKVIGNGSVELYYDNVLKVLTSSTGINLPVDGDSIKFGANSEVLLTHVHDVGLHLTGTGLTAKTSSSTANDRSGAGFTLTESATDGDRRANMFLDADNGAFGTGDSGAYFYIEKKGGGGEVSFINQDATALNFQIGGAHKRMVIDSSGKILHTPAAQGSAFDASDNTTWNALEIFQDRGVTNSGSGIAFRSQSGTNPAGIVSVAGNTTGGIESLAFITVAGNAGAERMRIDSSGNVGIGSTSPLQTLEIDGDVRIKDARSLFFKRHGDNYAWRMRNESASDSSTYGFDGSNDLVFEVVSNSNVQATPADASHSVYGNSGNTLVLHESGRVSIGTGNSDHVFQARGTGSNGSDGFYFENGLSSGTIRGMQIKYANAAPNDANPFFICEDNSAVKFIVRNNGNLENTNNSYTGISDLRIKEQISDATSQWNDIKALKVKKYKVKEQVSTLGDSDELWRIGLIAQDLEESGMSGLVREQINYTADDKEVIEKEAAVGDLKEYKAVKYSVLYMKAVKALQEAMEKIETLEAKVKALEEG